MSDAAPPLMLRDVRRVFRTEAGVQGRLLDKEHIEAAIKADIELR